MIQIFKQMQVLIGIDVKYLVSDISSFCLCFIEINNNSFIRYLYHKGKKNILQQDIKKSIHYYKEASSFNNQYAKNNIGFFYKNGFTNEIPKEPEYALIYFKEAIDRKKDKVAMYNMSHIIFENETDKSNDFIIDLLIKSSNFDFEPSTEMLCLFLIKKYGTNMKIIEEKISKYTKESKFLFQNLKQ